MGMIGLPLISIYFFKMKLGVDNKPRRQEIGCFAAVGGRFSAKISE
jgi:hypothetical protein